MLSETVGKRKKTSGLETASMADVTRLEPVVGLLTRLVVIVLVDWRWLAWYGTLVKEVDC